MSNKRYWIFAIPVIIALVTLNFWLKTKDNTGVPHPKTSFIYDVMAPIGMPLVSRFHHVRDNVFLNTASKQATGLEAIGNTFLAPTRFCFGGLDLDEDNQDLEQSFSYESNWGLKMFGSLVTMVPCQVIGTTLKALSFLSAETRERHNQIAEKLYSTDIISNQDAYTAYNLPSIYSSAFAPCQNHARSSRISNKLQTELKALKEICKTLDKHGIPYWADAGTLLGAYRYGGVIPWDCDIDLAVLNVDHDNVKNAMRTLDPEKYEIQDWSSYGNPKSFLKLFVKETGSHIDLYHYVADPEKKTLTFNYTWERTPFPESWKECDAVMVRPHAYTDIFPLKNTHFDGMIIRVPNNIVSFLHTLFGKNLDPTMTWNETLQEYEKVEDHPYWRHDNSQ